MSKLTNDIFEFYESQCNEGERLNNAKVDCVEFLTTMKYLKSICKPQSEILDACAGGGVYAFPLAEMGHKVTAGDLVEFNVEQIRKKQEATPTLKKIYTGTIMDLSMFDDDSFDVVLNFGAFYHLKTEEDRIKSIKESLRVLKNSGLYFMAYLNKYANYIKFNSQMKNNFKIFEEYIGKGYTEDECLFYASTPEAVEQIMPELGLVQMHNVAVDGPKFTMKDTLNSFSDEEFNRWLKIHYNSCEIKSLLGYSEHGLYIGRKIY